MQNSSDQAVKSSVQQANIALHTALAAHYNKDEPHWRPENVEKVTKILRELKAEVKGERMLDLGCGTGFMINIGKKLGFSEIHGYDITKAMIDQVDKSGPAKIVVEISDTGKIPCQSDYFDVATAYSFLSHLDELDSTVRQAYRCLRKGGVFYSDLDPNADFWEAIDGLDQTKEYHPFVQREVRHTKNNDKELADRYGVDPAVYNLAEFQKTKNCGMSEQAIRESLTAAGFKDIRFYFRWFVGQGLINNDAALTQDQRNQKMQTIDEFLTSALPLTKNLYKYISFIARK